MTETAAGKCAPGILIADDMPENLDLLARMLKSRGYKVRSALNGRLALQSVRNCRPDLILLDINMPELNGYEVCARLKADEELRKIPVIFLSGANETLDKIKAFGAGGADYITKPFNLDELMARVEAQLTLRSAREYLEEKNRFLEYTFARFVSPKVVEAMKNRPISEFLKMERCEATTLFADLRGFTSLANERTPEEVQETLNSALAVLVRSVEEADGMVDKFMGDGLMALFGAPFRQKDHALRALKAAVAMQRAHRGWMDGCRSGNKPCRPLGIGLVTGQVVVGAYGTRNRMEYTALGNAVNLASRLCDAAVEGEILTVPETLQKARAQAAAGDPLSFSAVPKGKLVFKHMPEPVDVISIKEEERYAGTGERSGREEYSRS